MASRLFPNTVYIRGLPNTLSRGELLRIFGGRKGYIKQLEFIGRPGEPKRVFLTYADHASVPRALAMDGAHLDGHVGELVVRRVDEHVLCEHVPGEICDLNGAFCDLQEVLREVLEERTNERRSLCMMAQKLNEFTDTVAVRDKLVKTVEELKMEKENVVKSLTTQLTQAHTQLKAVNERHAKMDALGDDLRKRLSEAEAQLKASQEFIGSMEKEKAALRGQLEEAQIQKHEALERSKMSNTKVKGLEMELKISNEERSDARSKLWRAESSLGIMERHLREADTREDHDRRKRHRLEEWLADEREAKRRLESDLEDVGARYRASVQQVDQGALEREKLEWMLLSEVAKRKEMEEELAHAKKKLDKVVVTDALLATFLKMENWAIRLLDDPSLPVSKH